MPIIYRGNARQTGANVSSFTMTIDVGTDSDRLIGVVLNQRGATLRPASGSFNSVALSSSGSGENLVPASKLHSDIFYLANPASGSNLLSITFDGGTVTQYECEVAWFSGVSQSGSFNFISGSYGQSASAIVDLSPNVDGCLLFGGAIHESATALISGSDQTSIYDNDNGAWVNSSAYIVQTTARSQQMIWTGLSDYWASAGVVFAPASSNVVPVVTLDTSASSVFTTITPTLEFTGSDVDGDDIQYQIQFSTNPDFSGSEVAITYSTGSPAIAGGFHANPTGGSTWEGEGQVDDRFGISFLGNGGILDRVATPVDTDGTDTDGTAVARIYGHQGTYGISGCPLNAASASDTPTSGWYAMSGSYYFSVANLSGSGHWHDFYFDGDDRILLEYGVPYFLIFDWRPNSPWTYNNLLEFTSTGSGLYDGQAYIDGDSPNLGIYYPADLSFGVYELPTLLTKISGSDLGFLNTVSGSDTSPFTQGDKVSYTFQSGSELLDGATYFWRVRGIDVDGSNSYGEWSETRNFIITLSGSGGGSLLVIADSDHAHTADNIDLTQGYSLVVADSDHAHTADNIDLTQGYSLVVADSDQAHTADNITLSNGIVLAVADSDHLHSVDNVELVQSYLLIVENGSHEQITDNLENIQNYSLSISDTEHIQTSDNIIISNNLTLVINDSNHIHSVDDVSLSQTYGLVVNDSDHGQNSDIIGLIQAYILVSLDSNHIHSVDNIDFIPEITGWVDLTLNSRTTNLTLSYRNMLFTVEERD